MLGYRKEPDFEVEPPGAPTNEERIAWMMYSNPAFREACEVEGVEVEWESVRRIAEEVVKRDKPPRPIRSKL